MTDYRKYGILVVNLGTPDAPTKKDVSRYLNQFLTDGRVIDIPWLSRQLLVRGVIVPRRSGNSTKLYRELWTDKGSPLKFYGEQVVALLQKKVGEDVSVVLAMRYQNPSIREGVDALLSDGVTDLIIFPMFPQYASATTGSVFEEVMSVLSEQQVIPSLTFIQDYFNHPAFQDVIVRRVREYDLAKYDHVLFTYHGLPQRQLIKADQGNHCLQDADCCQNMGSHNRNCYSAQCHATTRALAGLLGIKPTHYTTCFQSRLGKDPWIMPYTSDVLEDRAKQGDKHILVISPSFVADCLETTIEVEVEYQEEFVALGGEKLDLVPSLNDDARWVDAMLTIITERINLR